MAQLRSAVDAAAREPEVRIGDPNGLLRHLDVALWMHAEEQLRQPTGAEAASRYEVALSGALALIGAPPDAVCAWGAVGCA